MTHWLDAQTFLSVNGSDLFKHWRVNLQPGCVFSDSQWFWSAQILEKNSQTESDVCSAILISDSDMLKCRRATHKLYGCSVIHVSGSYLLKHLRATHFLDAHLDILVSHFLKHWRVTNFLNACPEILISNSDMLKHWVNSLAGCMFSHSCQCFWSVQTLESNSLARYVSSHSH